MKMTTTKSHGKLTFVFLITICFCIDAIPFAQEDETNNDEEAAADETGNLEVQEKVAGKIFICQ